MNNARCTCEIEPRIVMVKTAFIREKILSPTDWT
jgi:hypothetical protein